MSTVKPGSKETSARASAESDTGVPNVPDPIEFSRTLTRLAERAQRLMGEFVTRQAKEKNIIGSDPLNFTQAFLDLTTRMISEPGRLIESNVSLWSDYMTLWQRSMSKLLGQEGDPVIKPEVSDKRFKYADWDDNAIFDFIKQSYLLTARWMQHSVHNVEGIDKKDAKKIEFYTRQFVDALAPSNFIMTNPQVLRETIETRGENLARGLENLLDDLERGHGTLAIRMTDPDAFAVGQNVASTPGKVIYQNGLMQLIQYNPITEEVFRRPILIVPPWINKFYILDLRPSNSFIKWMVEQGHTVFVISWVNPDKRLSEKSFESYMLEGPMEALSAIEAATGEKEVNVIGYCIGGTLLAATLAVMSAQNDQRFKSALYLVSLTDFGEPGELGVFIDEEQLQILERRMDERGYLDGSAMSCTFNMLRANDLIWSFVVNNYLLGKEPFSFDLLYWNSDSTRMPRAMHSFYLRNMYQKNLLIQPGGITLDGVPVDLRKIKTPSFILSTKEDHIAPWKSTYAATQIYSGQVRFVLAASGHIAGVVNPPSAERYGYWVNARTPKTADAWLEGAEHREGSWWPEYQKWVSRHGGGKTAARTPGDGRLPVIEEAPGSYVKVKSS